MTDPTGPYNFFETPPDLALAGLRYLRDHYIEFIIDSFDWAVDAGAGTGIWGKAARRVFGPSLALCGVDNWFDDPGAPRDPYHVWYKMDYLKFGDGVTDAPKLIFGNPPYDRKKTAERFVIHSLKLLPPGGYLIFLLRLGMLAGQWRNEFFWPEYPPEEILVLGERPSFTGNAVTDVKTDYMLVIWSGNPARKKKAQGKMTWGFSWKGNIAPIENMQTPMF